MRGYHLVFELNSQSESRSGLSTFIPSFLFQHLPSHPSFPTRNRRSTWWKQPVKVKDYRHGPIRIDWVDFDIVESPVNTIVKHKEEKMSMHSTPIATFIQSTTLNEGTTNLPDGIIHIFRDGTQPQELKDSIASTSKVVQSTAFHQQLDGPSASISDHECITVAVLAVPPWMSTADFLAFVAPSSETMAHLRLIRDASPNRTMVVIQFRGAKSTAEFIEEFNGKQYNSVEPETCNIVRVKSIKIDIDEPVPLAITRLSANPGIMYELPTCPVCLDRMDSTITGLVTVPCSHTFHCMCLSKWGDSRCPVCRYSQTALSYSSKPSPGYSLNTSGVASNNMSTCSDCDSDMNLWICLICGNIGCSRQGRAHAKKHYELTTHLYALELETQRVWDYAGDNYVHRLIQSKADGKLVELPSASGLDDELNVRDRTGQGPGADDNLKAEKVEMMAMQYSQILQRALDDQRQSYEEQISELKRNLDDMKKKLDILSNDVEQQRLESLREKGRREKEEKAVVARLEAEKVKSDKKAEKFADLARQFEKELKEERAVSEGLLKNLTQFKEKAESAERDRSSATDKVLDLEDQLRDVMFFLQARSEIEEGGGAASEAAGGTIEIPPTTPPASKNVRRKKKAR